MRGLRRDRRGISTTEFALACPVIFGMMLGGLEIGHTMYVKAVLDGEVQKAARDLSLEDANDGDQAGIDRRDAIIAKARADIKQTISTARVEFTTTAYHDYSDAKNRAEPFTDVNHDGICNHFEPYTDSNNNNQWDADSGEDGSGNAKDVMLLVATATYPRLALSRFWADSDEVKLVSKTMLRNQPSTEQEAAPQRNCSL